MVTLQSPQKLYRTKEEYVYDTLRAAIMRSELQPGEKLVIDNLSEQLAVSPIPVRGALQRLQAEGLVEIIPHTGTVVSSISPDTVNEVFMLLAALESTAFSVVAHKATEADIAALEQLVDQMEQAAADSEADVWSDLNNQFHLAIARLANMKMLFEFTGRVLDSWDRLRRYYLKSFVTIRLAKAQAEHREMIELLKIRDAAGLWALANQHNFLAMDVYQELMEGQQEE